MKDIKQKEAGDKKNTAGGSWSAGFAKTSKGLWL